MGGGGKRETDRDKHQREGETLIICLLHAPQVGINLKGGPLAASKLEATKIMHIWGIPQKET